MEDGPAARAGTTTSNAISADAAARDDSSHGLGQNWMDMTPYVSPGNDAVQSSDDTSSPSRRPSSGQCTHLTGRFCRPRNAQPPIRTGSSSASSRRLALANTVGSATSAIIAREDQ